MTVGKAILIGMNNPHSTAAEHALYPAPVGVAGWRLWTMMDQAAGLPRSEYVRIFDRRNLVRGDWRRDLAATNAAVMFRKQRIDECRVVLCGAQVVEAFRKAGAKVDEQPHFTWFRPGPSPLGKWAIIPHPSGRSHTWNDKAVRDAAKIFFAELVELARKAAKED